MLFQQQQTNKLTVKIPGKKLTGLETNLYCNNPQYQLYPSDSKFQTFGIFSKRKLRLLLHESLVEFLQKNIHIITYSANI